MDYEKIFKNITLKPHQQDVLRFIDNNKHTHTGLVLCHSVGSGKTITSIAIIRTLMKPKHLFLVLTPKSLIGNFMKELNKVKNDFTEKELEQIHLFTHQSFCNLIQLKENRYLIDNCTIVVDEAHNFKRPNGKRFHILQQASRLVKHIYLLTATPIQNSPSEYANLWSLVTRNKPIYSDFNIHNSQLQSILRGTVSYYKSSPDNSDFPASKYHIIGFRMTEKYYEKYMMIETNQSNSEIFVETENLSIFFNGIRRGVNIVDSKIKNPKIEWVCKFMEKSKEKTVIYSNWIRCGLVILQKRLEKMKIKYNVINGSTSLENRTKIVSDYNNNLISVLFISSAGSEGLDLKGTRNIILLETFWNLEKEKQIVGRGVRFQSHSHLPKKERQVDIYTLILKKPEGVVDRLTSADEYLYNLSQEKNKLIETFYALLEKCSI